MIKDFGHFVVKLVLGRYDEMKWEDCFHAVMLVCVICGIMYLVLE